MTLLARLFALLRPAPATAPEVILAIERCCEIVDPTLRSLRGLEKRLAPAVQQALGYCCQLVDRLPPPVVVDRQAFASDPLVHAFLATADDLDQMLGKSDALRTYLSQSSPLDGDYVYALLAARQRCKKTLGVAMEGDMIRQDVAIEYLFFSDHSLAAPSRDPESLRRALRQAAFDSLLKSFRHHINLLREEKQSLRGNLDQQRDQISLMRQGTASAAQEIELGQHARQLAELQQKLRDSVQSLQPEHIASALADFLAQPESALQLNPVSFTLDRSGRIMSPEQAGPGVDKIDFMQLKGRDRRSYAVFTVALHRREAEQATAAREGLNLRSLVI